MLQRSERALLAVVAAGAILSFVSIESDAQEACRELGRTATADEDVIVRECRAPRAAAAEERRTGDDWSPGPANDPANCRDLWEKIGIPANAGDEDVEAVPVCHKGYLLGHNNEKRTPDWVLEHLTAEQVSGDNSRPGGGFKPEPAVPKAAQAVDLDYKKSGYARGHQAPSEDFNVDAALMKDTFFFSNVVPQVGIGFNSGIWSALESLVRELARTRGEIYVITGPIYQDRKGRPQTITDAENACEKVIELDSPPDEVRKKAVCGANNKDPAVSCGDAGAAVPAALYKIIYDPVNERVNAYVLPNRDHRELKGKTHPLAYLENYRTTVHVVEEYTGLRFFTGLPARRQRVQKENCVATMLR